jgi:hypothetical protein
LKITFIAIVAAHVLQRGAKYEIPESVRPLRKVNVKDRRGNFRRPLSSEAAFCNEFAIQIDILNFKFEQAENRTEEKAANW